MKMLTRRVLPLALTAALGGLLAEPEVAVAQIYRWLDAEGTIHFSQGVESVPGRFRSSAVIIGYDRPASPAEPSPASTPAPLSGTGEIKFTLGQPIMVTARINGAGSAQLMLDTGAVRTVISPAVLATLGVRYENAQRATLKGVTGDAEVQAVRVESLEVSGVKYGPLLVVSHDTGFGPGRGDGLLGRDFLDNFTVTIDNATGTLTLTSK